MLKSKARKNAGTLNISASGWDALITDAEQLILKHCQLIDALKTSINSLKEMRDQDVALPKSKKRGRPLGRTSAMPNRGR